MQSPFLLTLKRRNLIVSLYFAGGPYAAFAGRDATRGLGTGQVSGAEGEYDDVSDLSPDEVASAKEWEEQFRGTQIVNIY